MLAISLKVIYPWRQTMEVIGKKGIDKIAQTSREKPEASLEVLESDRA